MLCQHFQLRQNWVNTMQKICHYLLREYKQLAYNTFTPPSKILSLDASDANFTVNGNFLRSMNQTNI